MTRRRYLALHLPGLPLDRLTRLDPSLRRQPLATWDTRGNRRLIIAAAAPGVATGQALADGQAMCSELGLQPSDEEAYATMLERLALWCLRWTLLVRMHHVALDGPGLAQAKFLPGDVLVGGGRARISQDVAHAAPETLVSGRLQ